MPYGLHKIERTTTAGPETSFDCPACGNRSVSASTEGVVERWLSFHIFPLFRVRYTDLTCGVCGARFRLDDRLEKVAAMPPEELSRRLRTRVPIFAKYLVVIGLGIPLLVASAAAASGVFGSELLASSAFAVVAGVGFILCGVGLAASARKASAWKLAAALGMVPLIVSLLFLLTKSVTGKVDHPSGSFRPRPQPGAVQAPRPELNRPPMQPSGATTFSVGEKVEGKWAGRWRPAVVTESRGQILGLRFEDSETPSTMNLPASLVRQRP